MDIKRGEVFYADLSPVVGSEQGGVRPVLILQNDVGNRHSPTVIAAAITSKSEKNPLPTHIQLPQGAGLTPFAAVSMVMNKPVTAPQFVDQTANPFFLCHKDSS